MVTIKYVKYQCGKCRADDVLKLFEGEPVPPAVNCWKCGAGRGMEPVDMIQTNKGMFVVSSSPAHPEEAR